MIHNRHFTVLYLTFHSSLKKQHFIIILLFDATCRIFITFFFVKSASTLILLLVPNTDFSSYQTYKTIFCLIFSLNSRYVWTFQNLNGTLHLRPPAVLDALCHQFFYSRNFKASFFED